MNPKRSCTCYSLRAHADRPYAANVWTLLDDSAEETPEPQRPVHPRRSADSELGELIGLLHGNARRKGGIRMISESDKGDRVVVWWPNCRLSHSIFRLRAYGGHRRRRNTRYRASEVPTSARSRRQGASLRLPLPGFRRIDFLSIGDIEPAALDGSRRS